MRGFDSEARKFVLHVLVIIMFSKSEVQWKIKATEDFSPSRRYNIFPSL